VAQQVRLDSRCLGNDIVKRDGQRYHCSSFQKQAVSMCDMYDMPGATPVRHTRKRLEKRSITRHTHTDSGVMYEYIIASSVDSAQYHPDALNQTLELGTHWLVGLSEIAIVYDADSVDLVGNDPLELYVCSNIYNVTYVGGNKAAILLQRFLTRTRKLEYFERVVNPVYGDHEVQRD
jgi:hypothetical protein